MTTVYSLSRQHRFEVCDTCDHWCADDNRQVVPREAAFGKKCKCSCHVEVDGDE